MNNDYNLTRFTNTGSRLGNYSISLSSANSFGFLSGFYTKENVKKYKKVILFFDNEKKAVGFKFTNDPNVEGAFTIIHGGKRTTGSVTARSFIFSNDLNEKKYFGKKTPKKIQDSEFGEVFIIDLLQETKNSA